MLCFIEAFQNFKICQMIRRHQELILNYFRAEKDYSSGIVEGFANKVKLTIRKSYGGRSDTVFSFLPTLPTLK